MDHKDSRLNSSTVAEILEIIISLPAWLWKDRKVSAVLHAVALSAFSCAGLEVLQLYGHQSLYFLILRH